MSDGLDVKLDGCVWLGQVESDGNGMCMYLEFLLLFSRT